MRQEDVPNTFILIRYGSFELLVIPFGVTNSPSVFQALINTVFRDVTDVFVICYLGDILVYSRSEEGNRHHVEELFQRLRK
jgi:Reverse transcriptase (RNA-dependent DNA polymerase)